MQRAIRVGARRAAGPTGDGGRIQCDGGAEGQYSATARRPRTSGSGGASGSVSACSRSLGACDVTLHGLMHAFSEQQVGNRIEPVAEAIDLGLDGERRRDVPPAGSPATLQGYAPLAVVSTRSRPWMTLRA